MSVDEADAVALPSINSGSIVSFDSSSLSRKFSWSTLLPALPHMSPVNDALPERIKERRPFLIFPSNDLELEYMDWKYGGDRNLVLFFGFLFAVPLLVAAGLTQDLAPGSPLWSPITRSLVALWLFLQGICFALPAVMRRKWLLEIMLFLTFVFCEMRFVIRDLYEQRFDFPYCAIKSGLGLFEVIFHAVLRPRLILTLCECLVTGILFSIVMLIWYFTSYGPSEWTAEPIASLFGYWFHMIVISLTVYLINRSDREYFLVTRKLKLQESQVEEACARTEDYLKNIVPSNLIPMIVNGELEAMGQKAAGENEEDSEDGDFEELETQLREYYVPVGCLLDERPQGCVVEADIVEFTAWSQLCDPNVVIRVINFVMCLFDVLSQRLDVEKLRTAGDSWLGFGVDRESWVNAVTLAVSMIHGMRLLNEELTEHDGVQLDLHLRVGVAAGKTLYLAVQGSIHASLSFDAFGELTGEVVELEQSAVVDGVHLNDSVQDVVVDSFCFESNMIKVPLGWEKNAFGVVKDERIADKIVALVSEIVTGLLQEEDRRTSMCQKRDDDEEEGPDTSEERTPVTNATEHMDETEGEPEGGCCARFCSKIAVSCRNLRCISEHGLIYPLATFRNLKREWECQKDLFSRNGRYRNALNFTYLILFHLVILLMSGVTFPTVGRFTENPWTISVYVCIVIEVIFTGILLFLAWREWLLPGVSIIFFWVHFGFFEAESVLMMLYCSRFAALRIMFTLNHQLFLAWDALTPVSIRLIIMALDSVVYFLDVLYVNYYDLNVGIELASLLPLIWFMFVFVALSKDLREKYEYDSRDLVVQRTEELVIEIKKNENLLQSVVPKPVLGLLYQLKGRSFSSRMNMLFISFLKVSCFQGFYRDGIRDIQAVESMVLFLATAFHEFDSVLETGDCVRVKRFQDSYIFISKSGEKDGLISSLQAIRGCVETFKRSLKWCQGTRRQAEEDRPTLQIGLSHGRFHSGVFGRIRYMFDILGKQVNLAARLCHSSDAFLTTVSDDDLGSLPSECAEELVMTSRGEIVMKGIGDRVSCSYVSLS